MAMKAGLPKEKLVELGVLAVEELLGDCARSDAILEKNIYAEGQLIYVCVTINL